MIEGARRTPASLSIRLQPGPYALAPLLPGWGAIHSRDILFDLPVRHTTYARERDDSFASGALEGAKFIQLFIGPLRFAFPPVELRQAVMRLSVFRL